MRNLQYSKMDENQYRIHDEDGETIMVVNPFNQLSDDIANIVAKDVCKVMGLFYKEYNSDFSKITNDQRGFLACLRYMNSK